MRSFQAKIAGTHVDGTDGVSGDVMGIVAKLGRCICSLSSSSRTVQTYSSFSYDHLRPRLDSIGEQLLSNKSDDALSSYVMDFVGLDEMDLAVQIMANRREVGQAVGVNHPL